MSEYLCMAPLCCGVGADLNQERNYCCEKLPIKDGSFWLRSLVPPFIPVNVLLESCNIAAASTALKGSTRSLPDPLRHGDGCYCCFCESFQCFQRSDVCNGLSISGHFRQKKLHRLWFWRAVKQNLVLPADPCFLTGDFILLHVLVRVTCASTST